MLDRKRYENVRADKVITMYNVQAKLAYNDPTFIAIMNVEQAKKWLVQKLKNAFELGDWTKVVHFGTLLKEDQSKEKYPDAWFFVQKIEQFVTIEYLDHHLLFNN